MKKTLTPKQIVKALRDGFQSAYSQKDKRILNLYVDSSVKPNQFLLIKPVLNSDGVPVFCYYRKTNNGQNNEFRLVKFGLMSPEIPFGVKTDGISEIETIKASGSWKYIQQCGYSTIQQLDGRYVLH